MLKPITKLVAGLLVASLCSSLAAADTTGTTVAGYTFGSDIQGYLDISADVCDMIAAVDARDFTSARAIYANGQNSLRSDGSTRKLQDWAAGGSEEEAHWGLYAGYYANDTEWVNTFVQAGFDGTAPWTAIDAQAQVVKKGVQSNLLVAYMFHEIDEAAEAVEAGETDAKTGAPHKVDEAAAIFFGTTCPAGNVADVANKRANTFGTLTTGPDGVCTAASNVAVAQALSALQAAALAGNSTAYAAATKDLEKALVTIYTQATLTYAQRLEELVAAGSPIDAARAEGVAFFRTIEPMVAQVAPESADAISVALASPAKGVAAEVDAAFKPALTAYGITAAELGSRGSNSSCALPAASPPTAASPPAPTGSAASLPAGSALATALAAAAAGLVLMV